MIIHVFGKIGTGKSLVAQFIHKKYNFKYIDVDDIGKKIYDVPEMFQWVKENVPEAILSNKTIDRSILRSVLFQNYELNNKLLKLSLPIVEDFVLDTIKKKPNKNYVIESFFFETIKSLDVAKTIVMFSDHETLIERVTKRDKRTIVETEMLLTFQEKYVRNICESIWKGIPPTNAHFIYNNNSIKKTLEEIKKIIKELLEK